MTALLLALLADLRPVPLRVVDYYTSDLSYCAVVATDPLDADGVRLGPGPHVEVVSLGGVVRVSIVRSSVRYF